MNEVTVFAELRPDVQPLTAGQVEVLRAHLFSGAELPSYALDVADHIGDSDVASAEVAVAPAVHSRHRRAWLIAAAALVALLGVAATWALNASRSDGPSVPAEPGPPAVPESTPGVFPYGGRDGAIAAGYSTPADVAAAYLADITDPGRLPQGFAVTGTVQASDPAFLDEDHAGVAITLRTPDDEGGTGVLVRRVATSPDVWQVVSVVMMRDELTDVSFVDGVVTGTIAPGAGGSTTLYVYDLDTGETIDSTTLTIPSTVDGVSTTSASFSLTAGDRQAVGLRYWNTVAPAGPYAFANVSDQAVTAAVKVATDGSTAPPAPATTRPAT